MKYIFKKYINTLLTVGAVVATSCTAHSQEMGFDLGVQPQFWALDSSEYTLKFQGHVELQSLFKPNEEKALNQANKQVEFLFGTFDHQHRQGVPKVNHKIKILSITEKSTMNYDIQYFYEGTAQISGSGSSYNFYLPINPDKVYLKSLVVKNGMTEYPCGDSEHFQSQYFWYFFNPTAYGCPLVEGVDYYEIQGQLLDLPKTTQTFPEYSRMIDGSGVLKASVFYGLNAYGDVNPDTSSDVNASSVRAMRSYLKKKGFTSKKLTMDEIMKVLENRTFDLPFVEVFSKKINSNTGVKQIQITVFFGSTDINGGYGFHKFFAQALSSDSVVIYAGHSGLGSYLSPQKIKSISNVDLSVPKENYQLIFFNGCSSYPYYGAPYFKMKSTDQDPEGTKNLDIMTNGLATYFSAITPSNEALMSAVLTFAESGVKTSYQDIITRADSGNLLSILGDEDNN